MSEQRISAALRDARDARDAEIVSIGHGVVDSIDDAFGRTFGTWA
jgi:hypothetical protein